MAVGYLDTRIAKPHEPSPASQLLLTLQVGAAFHHQTLPGLKLVS